MSLVELLPEVNELPRADKLRLLEILAGALAREEEGQPGLRGDIIAQR